MPFIFFGAKPFCQLAISSTTYQKDSITFTCRVGWGKCSKTFYVRNLRVFLISNTVSGKAFQHNLMFVGETGAYLS
jgi:hypothetical protein